MDSPNTKAIQRAACSSIDNSLAMNSKKLFSIFNSSFWIALYYSHKLKKQRSDSGALALLLKSFWYGPRLWQVSSINHVEGNCFQIKLDASFLSDEHGKSSLLLLENNSSLPYPATFDINKIIQKGRGRYLCTRDSIYFSPSDNADLATVASRSYLVLDTLTEDLASIEELLAINKTFNQTSNPIHHAIKKLSVYFKEKLSFSAFADLGPNALGLQNINLNLSQWHSGKWHIARLEIFLRPETNGVSLQINFFNRSDTVRTCFLLCISPQFGQISFQPHRILLAVSS